MSLLHDTGKSPETLLATNTPNVTNVAEKELPATCIATNIYVHVSLNLEDHDTSPAAAKRASEIEQTAQDILSKTYTASETNGQYILKVYVILASPHSVWNKITIGMIGTATTECFEWFLMSSHATNNEALRAGRVGVCKSRCKISTLTAELCESLIEKIGVK
jgi:hypothetical protein